MQIHILDSETIDKIAAGEVVERPASVVKELVENAIDAGADAITVEAKDGGISFIRVTDNGCGMEKEQIPTAFLRHATSKIENADDLARIASLGFRGEALSSIAAVSRVELITKPKHCLTGTRIVMEGAVAKGMEEIGAPDGTTFLMRNLFYNTPVRRKFLKQPATEGSYIAELMEHMALSRPDISFKFILGSQTRFHTSGNGDLKEVIYRIYGRDVAGSLVPVSCEKNGIRLEGYLGKPIMVRSNRNFEIYFINGRFIKSTLLARAIEEGYKEYLMQHKFPFCVLHFSLDPARVDVNVHPTKMDVRFSDAATMANTIADMVREALQKREMIPEFTLEDEHETAQNACKKGGDGRKLHTPEAFETQRTREYRLMEETRFDGVSESHESRDFSENPVWARVKEKTPPQEVENDVTNPSREEPFFLEPPDQPDPVTPVTAEPIREEVAVVAEQRTLFEEKILTADHRMRFRVIGQVFDTYWMIQYEDKFMIVDQHAAHEKVKYERMMKHFREHTIASQLLMPPIVVSLSGKEEGILSEYRDVFERLGFEIESFGGNEYSIRSVPVELYGCGERELFLAVLDELADGGNRGSMKAIEEKIASMSCKAAVKGNNRLSEAEAEKLIDELLTLDNPYNCPHGRPTVIVMSKYELEKKFKRIV